MTVNLTEWDNVSQFVDPQTGALSIRGQVWLQTILEQINTNFGALEAADAALAAAQLAQAAAETAQAAADTAQAAAEDAQSSASGVSSEAALANSGTIGCVIHGTDAGATASITISAHARAYGDGSTVPVSAGSVTGLDFSTQYWIYYLDPTRAGGGVTYLATDDAATAVQGGDTHTVGTVTTPADGAADTDGISTPAPGNVS